MNDCARKLNIQAEPDSPIFSSSGRRINPTKALRDLKRCEEFQKCSEVYRGKGWYRIKSALRRTNALQQKWFVERWVCKLPENDNEWSGCASTKGQEQGRNQQQSAKLRREKTLGHVLGFFPKGELLPNSRHRRWGLWLHLHFSQKSSMKFSTRVSVHRNERLKQTNRHFYPRSGKEENVDFGSNSQNGNGRRTAIKCGP